MIGSETLQVESQLDAHHIPETNGRIAVCRRCGARTDTPEGLRHVVAASQVKRSGDWLVAQSRLRDIESARLQRTR
jgi:hypothetical protein